MSAGGRLSDLLKGCEDVGGLVVEVSHHFLILQVLLCKARKIGFDVLQEIDAALRTRLGR